MGDVMRTIRRGLTRSPLRGLMKRTVVGLVGKNSKALGAIKWIDSKLMGYRYTGAEVDLRADVKAEEKPAVEPAPARPAHSPACGRASSVPDPEQPCLAWMSRVSGLLSYKPRFIVCLPAGDEAAHEGTLESLDRQTYPGWEVCHGLDSLASAAEGDWVVFIGQGGLLRPHALFEIAVKLNITPALDVIYADEDRVDSNGTRNTPFFKPDWSPDLLLSMNYVGDFFAVRRDFLKEVSLAPANDMFDLLLRLTERSGKVGHVPQVLYTRRPGWGPDRDEVSAVKSSLARRGMEAGVSAGPMPGLVDVRRILKEKPLVSIIIHARAGDGAGLSACIRSIMDRTSYPDFEVVIINSGTGSLSKLEKVLSRVRYRILEFNGPFNLSKAMNEGARNAQGGLLLFVDGAVEAVAPEWLDALVENSVRPEVGVVGGKLLYPDNTVSHAGIFLVDHGSGTRRLFAGFDGGSDAHFGFLHAQRNCSAVSLDCFMVSRRVFDELSGFDDGLRLSGTDVDFCLRALEKGYLVVWTPRALLAHNKAKGPSDEGDADDARYFWGRWRRVLEAGDPYYNPNLTLQGGDLVPSSRPVAMEGRIPFLVDEDKVRNILVVKLDHLGDVILSFPAVRLLRQKFPKARITALVGSWSRKLMERCPDVDVVETYDYFFAVSKKKPVKLDEAEKKRVRDWLRGMKIDLAVDLRKPPEAREFLRLSGARYTAGFDMGSESWLTVRLKDHGKYDHEHLAVHLSKLIAAIPSGRDYIEETLLPPVSREKAAEAISKVMPYKSGDLVIGIHPGAGIYYKKWPEEHFARLADIFAERMGARVLFFGGPDDVETVGAIIGIMQAKGQACSAAGMLSLDEFLAAVTLCRIFIGNDSGPMHMAAANGVPTVGIFSGLVPPQEYAPLGLHITVRLKIVCALCGLPDDCPSKLDCIRVLNPEKVYEAAQRLLAVKAAKNYSKYT